MRGLEFSLNPFIFAVLKIQAMAVTALQRKELKNKTKSRLKKQHRKLQTKIATIKSPFKGESGVIVEE